MVDDHPPTCHTVVNFFTSTHPILSFTNFNFNFKIDDRITNTLVQLTIPPFPHSCSLNSSVREKTTIQSMSDRQRRARFDHPPLTPSLCFTTSALKEFLRLSRSSIDDSISQNLNALSTPSKSPFDPSTLSARGPAPSTFRHLPAQTCRAFTEQILLPSWQSRSDVLNYCASVATSNDPEDPDSLVRLAEGAADRERVVDERLDPYSGRFFPRESRTEVLAQVVRNERMVESIVRERTWRVVKERCGEFGALEEDWRGALDAWRAKEGGV
ncbi:hypothetical protein L873DRAFT_918486 [Choiromyces venosus 120613-1]|uniref:Caffeine-induced death protein Cid2 n=1 Tax=Choiromyces venosus 120613-1 TaxID=1336337 RepID=A0A3N4K085_9PEZI|nr:hypothetical protein L873DRAFT_918486 [Choiromyces venosus 120613-1]